MNNQRQFLRKALDSTVSVFTTKSYEYIGLLADCSETGCMISSASPIDTEQEYIVTIIDLPTHTSNKRSGNLTLKAVWSDQVTSSMYGTGFEIINSSDEAATMFKEYLSR
jgi:hypothetical protein